MPTIRVDANLRQVETRLRRFSDGLDLRPFWRELGETLADEAQRRWPLRRKTGRLRESLRWAGKKLGRGGVFEASPDQARVWERDFLFEIRAAFGTRKQRATPLIHVNEADASTRLGEWATRAG